MKLTLTLMAAALLAPAMATAQYSSPVREVDVPARSAFSLFFNCTTGGTISCTPANQIPAGHWFVIEHIAYLYNEAASSNGYFSFWQIRNNAAQGLVFLAPTSVQVLGGANPYRRVIGAHSTRLYVDGVSNVYFSGVQLESGGVMLIMHGHLVKK